MHEYNANWAIRLQDKAHPLLLPPTIQILLRLLDRLDCMLGIAVTWIEGYLCSNIW